MPKIKSVSLEPRSGKKRHGGRWPRLVFRDEHGNRTFETLKNVTPQQAKAILARRQIQIAEGMYNLRPQSTKLSFTALMTKHLEEKERTAGKAEFRNVLNAGKKFIRIIGEMYVKDITPVVVDEFIYRLQNTNTRYGKPHSVETINSYIRHLSPAFSKLEAERRIEKNPFTGKKLKVKKVYRPRTEPFNDDELYRIDSAMQPQMPWLLFAYQFALQTGVRCEEILDARLNRIVWDARPYIWITGKGKKDRKVPLSSFIIERIEERKRIMTDSALRTALIKGSNVSRNTERNYERLKEGYLVFEVLRADSITKAFGDILRELGIMEGSMHRLRHTFGQTYLRKGGRIEDLSMILGHADVTITYKRYAHIEVEKRGVDGLTFTPPKKGNITRLG